MLALIEWIIEWIRVHHDIISAISGIVSAGAIIIGLAYWFDTEQDRIDQIYYAAWTQINAASVSSSNISHTTINNPTSASEKIPCENPERRVGDSGRRRALENLNSHDNSLAGAPLSYSILPLVELQEANLDRVDLSHADLFGAKLQGADMWGGQLQNSNLSFAHLEGTNLRYARLEYACLEGAHLNAYTLFLLSEVNYHNFNLKTEQKNKNVREWLEAFYSRPYTSVITDMRETCLKNANLRGANLAGANLTDADLEHAQLEGFPLDDLDLLKKKYINIEKYDTNLDRYAKAIGVEYPAMVWPETNLTDANLTDANLTDANLTGANLTRANLTRANLSGTKLGETNVEFEQIDKAYLCKTELPKDLVYVDSLKNGNKDCDKDLQSRKEICPRNATSKMMFVNQIEE